MHSTNHLLKTFMPSQNIEGELNTLENLEQKLFIRQKKDKKILGGGSNDREIYLRHVYNAEKGIKKLEFNKYGWNGDELPNDFKDLHREKNDK